jgi:hypothetical protein
MKNTNSRGIPLRTCKNTKDDNQQKRIGIVKKDKTQSRELQRQESKKKNTRAMKNARSAIIMNRSETKLRRELERS